jgi:fluoroquinolone resistance protein
VNAEIYICGQTFDKVPLPVPGEYEDCTFHHCDFSGQDLSKFRFTDCNFNGCNLSLVTCNNTVFQNIRFKDCKMLGIRFDTCSQFGISFSFEDCQLQHSSFYKMKNDTQH